MNRSLFLHTRRSLALRVVAPLLASACLYACTFPGVSTSLANDDNATHRPGDADQATLRAAERSGNGGLAIQLAEQQLKQYPARWELRVTLARLWSQAGRSDEAVQALAPLGDDHRPLVLRERARVALGRQQALQARQWLEEALNKIPQLPEAGNMLGVALEMLGQPAAAQDRYRTTLAITEDDATRYNLGRSLLQNGQAGEAVKILQPLTEHGNQAAQPALYAAMATALVQSGQPLRARALLENWMPPATVTRWLSQEKRP